VGKRTKQIDKSKIPGETALLNAVFVGYGIAFSRSFLVNLIGTVSCSEIDAH